MLMRCLRNLIYQLVRFTDGSATWSVQLRRQLHRVRSDESGPRAVNQDKKNMLFSVSIWLQ